MDYKEVTERHIEECKHRIDVITDFMKENKDSNKDKCLENIETLKAAISAIQELQMYKDAKLCLIPEDVFSRQCEELDEYKELGTLEEVRKAVERQQAKKAIDIRGDKLKFCTCPSCGRRITDIEGGNYCQNCGQRLSWSEENVR